MTLSDDDVLLAEMAIRASIEPCQVPRDDLLRLIVLAGYGPGTQVYQSVMAEPERVIVLREGLQMFIALAREA